MQNKTNICFLFYSSLFCSSFIKNKIHISYFQVIKSQTQEMIITLLKYGINTADLLVHFFFFFFATMVKCIGKRIFVFMAWFRSNINSFLFCSLSKFSGKLLVLKCSWIGQKQMVFWLLSLNTKMISWTTSDPMITFNLSFIDMPKVKAFAKAQSF